MSQWKKVMTSICFFQHTETKPNSMFRVKNEMRLYAKLPNPNEQSAGGAHLGVWARVKRRRWLMLRFMSSFLKSRGEFRGEPRGESRGECLGEPTGEPFLDLGLIWMMGSLCILSPSHFSSRSDWSSSELISLMARWLKLVFAFSKDLLNTLLS